MQNVDLVEIIRSAIVNKKLIKNSHEKLMPAIRRQQMAAFEHNTTPKLSAVLLLLYQKDDILHFVLTKRASYDGIHSGQVSLPGGKFDPTDSSLEYTALRETYEEIGIPSLNIEVIGPLSELFIPPSNFHVTPFVGFLKSKPDFFPDPTEVASIIEVPVVNLLDEKNVRIKHFEVSMHSSIEAPYFQLNDAEVWGATAMILSEFREIVRMGLK